MILSEKANFSYVPYEPRQEFLEHSRNRGDLIKRRRKLDGGVILSRCSKALKISCLVRSRTAMMNGNPNLSRVFRG